VFDLELDWETLQDKLAEQPALFTRVLWPALQSAGWECQAYVGTAAGDPCCISYCDVGEHNKLIQPINNNQ